MFFLAFFIYPWVPYALLVIALVVIGLIMLASRARRRLWKIALGVSAPLVLIASCTGLVIGNSHHAPLVNVPAPVSASLSLTFFEYPGGGAPATVDTLSARTGAVRWRQALGNTEVQIAADEHSLYIDGKTLWRSSLSNLAQLPQPLAVTASPILADGMVYISAYRGRSGGVIDALRASDGSLAWSLTLEDYHEDFQVHALVAGQGMLFAGSPTGNISAFRSSDGAPVWTWHAPPDEAHQVVPAFAGGVVYVACYKQIVALHAGDGTLLWSLPLATPLSNYHLGIGASSIYFEHVEDTPTGYPDYLYRVNAQTGAIQWKYQVVNPFRSRAIEAGNLVFFASDRYLDALRVSDGQRVWRHSSNSNVGFGEPLIVNNVLFVNSFVVYPRIPTTCPDECEPSAAVNALNVTTGALYWRSAWSGIGPSAPLGPFDLLS
jgi:outer membrane protein assembly factor BamB